MCDHEFNNFGELSICVVCGYQSEDINYNYDTTTYKHATIVTMPKIYQTYNSYLEDMSETTRQKIYTLFEELVQQNNPRGDGKRALLAACDFYIGCDEGRPQTSKNIQQKYGITRHKFSDSKQLLLNNYKHYRLLEMKISNYIDCVFTNFNFDKTYKPLLREKIKPLDAELKFVNHNPFSVCACFVYKWLLEHGSLEIKRNAFVKKVGMSDVTITKIINLLPEIK
jgi:transcription initiation factor TFIIIB Brf1 subunit/transcription initiation factor TFIIB